MEEKPKKRLFHVTKEVRYGGYVLAEDALEAQDIADEAIGDDPDGWGEDGDTHAERIGSIDDVPPMYHDSLPWGDQPAGCDDLDIEKLFEEGRIDGS